MDKKKTYSGNCFCGDIQVEVEGEPEAMGFCHCNSCRLWSTSLVNAFTLWKPENVKITQGEAKVGAYHKTPKSIRKWCTTCGGHILTVHPMMDLVDVYAVIVPALPFKAGFHLHYQDTIHPMKDGLPKFKDLPAEAGGSGEQLPE